MPASAHRWLHGSADGMARCRLKLMSCKWQRSHHDIAAGQILHDQVQIIIVLRSHSIPRLEARGHALAAVLHVRAWHRRT